MLGQSFAPLFGQMDEERRRRKMMGRPGGVAQSPVETLGLRLPRVMGAQSPVPKALLTSPGSAGVIGGGNPLIAAILQAVMGGSGQDGSMPMPMPGTMPGAMPPMGPMPSGATPPVGPVGQRPPSGGGPGRGPIDSGGPLFPSEPVPRFVVENPGTPGLFGRTGGRRA